MKLIYHICAAAILFALPAFAQVSERSVRIRRVEQPPKLEDFIAGAIPPNQTAISEFRQQKPEDGNPSTLPTVAYASFDDDNLYVVFLCSAPREKIRARLSKRDDMFSDDYVVVYLDTFHDRQHGLSFFANPFGIQGDSIYTEGQGDDYNYDIIWKSEGRLTPDGYAVRFSIPFKSIRFPNSDAQSWGFSVSRFIADRNEVNYWPYYTNRIEGFVSQFGVLDGIERISPGRNLQFIPYGTFTHLHSLDTPDEGIPSFGTHDDFRGGLDSKVILHDALTLDVTLNPDFSQVESNDPQVTTNQRFEVFFPEKRPFFLENANYFQTPENLFFTRRIQDPEFGGRLTGKMGAWSLGVLAMDDRSPGNQLAQDDPRFGKHAGIQTIRLQRQLGEQSTAGGFATYYRFGSDSELVVSGDTRLKFTPNLVLTGQVVRSDSRTAASGHSRGADYFGQLAYTDLHFSATSKYLDRTPFFSSQLGYIPRVDIRQVQQDVSYKWLPARRLVKFFGPTLSLGRDWDHQNQVQDWLVTPGFTTELAGQTDVTIGHTQALEVFQNIPFRKHSTDLSFNTDVWKQVGIVATFSSSARVNYYPGAGQPFLASGKDLNLTLTFRPTSSLRIDQIYIFSHLQTLDTHGAILNNHLFRTTMNYQFTRSWSLRAIGDYDAVLPNGSLIDLERTKKFTGDLLLTYLLNPGTALYVGYTDTRENLALVGEPPQLIRTINPNTATGRQLFVKLSYLFHF